MERWSVGSFNQIDWQWPREVIKPLSTVLHRRFEVVNRDDHDFASLQLATLHFDGELEPRELRGKVEFKGKLFFAHAGDVIYSKIDVRNGAIGIVPDSMPRVAVSAEYPVYQVDAKLASPDYIKLIFRTRIFRNRINAMISGASGRKRVQPDVLEELEAPLPPLAEQRAIVERWRSAQVQIAAASVRVEKVRERIDHDCYAAIGFKIAERKTPPKVFAAPWAGFGRWSVSFNQQTLTGMNLEAGKYPLATLDSFLTLVQYGTSEKANEQGRGVPVLRIGNIKDRVVDMTNLKHIELSPKTVESLTLKDGDMLIIRTSGSRDLVGTCAVFHGNDQAVFASYLIRLRFDTARANPDYVCWFLNSALGRQQVDSISRQIMQNNINSEEIRTLRVPLPALEVQRKLVERVTAARAEVARERAAATRLRQTIAAEVESLILGTKTPPKT
jgi:type I restriction enzyme S subunit